MCTRVKYIVYNLCKPNWTRVGVSVYVRCVYHIRMRQCDKYVLSSLPKMVKKGKKKKRIMYFLCSVHTVNFIGGIFAGFALNSTLKLLSCVVSSRFSFSLSLTSSPCPSLSLPLPATLSHIRSSISRSNRQPTVSTEAWYRLSDSEKVFGILNLAFDAIASCSPKLQRAKRMSERIWRKINFILNLNLMQPCERVGWLQANWRQDKWNIWFAGESEFALQSSHEPQKRRRRRRPTANDRKRLW